jgi:hypothetical protein
MKALGIAVVVAIASVSAVPPAAAQANLFGAPGNCDKACLTGIADAYFAALVAHDPSKAPMAPRAKATENTMAVNIGDGLWKTASEAPSNFKIYVPDPVSGQLGAIVLMKDAGKPVQLALRLKVVNKQITEAEHVISRNANEAAFQAPSPGLLTTLSAAERIPRHLMLAVGQSYYDALEQSDGSAAPFADDCSRRENGMTTGGVGAGRGGPPRAGGPGGPAPTGAAPRAGAPGAPAAGGAANAGPGPGFGPSTCAAQINTRTFYYITSIDLRRVWIADEERGLVFGMTMFRHPMEEKTFTVLAADGTPSVRDMSTQKPFDFESIHIFKIVSGRIREIEAMGISLPLRSKNGWSEFWR